MSTMHGNQNYVHNPTDKLYYQTSESVSETKSESKSKKDKGLNPGQANKEKKKKRINCQCHLLKMFSLLCAVKLVTT
jgi:hypothetical protein